MSADAPPAPQRKPSWTAADVSRFSELLQTEHAVQAEEAAARLSLRDAEERVDAGLVGFMDALRERYQQEQVRCIRLPLDPPPLTQAACASRQLYVEASRRVATYGTWGLLAVNTALFLGTQLVVEPSKRRRMEASMRAAVAEQGDRILAGLPAAAGAQQHGVSAASVNDAARQAAMLGVLHAIDARQATMAARLDALATARARPEEAAATPSKPATPVAKEHAELRRDRVAALRFALSSAWAALPPGPLTGARSDWIAGVVGCAAVGGIASGGLLLAALGLASSGK